LPAPGTFRPQGFAPSRRFAPRSDARPCFMPVTSMGFHPSGVFPRGQVPGLVTQGNALLVFLLRWPGKLYNIPSAEARRCRVVYAADAFVHLQGLAPTRESVLPIRCYPGSDSRSPLGLPDASPGCLPQLPGTARVPCTAPALRPNRLLAATAPRHRAHPARNRVALQRISQRARLLGFSASALPS
jgi:hypothetical protein